MTLPARPDADDPTPPVDDGYGVVMWMIAGCALILVYVATLALLRPAG